MTTIIFFGAVSITILIFGIIWQYKVSMSDKIDYESHVEKGSSHFYLYPLRVRLSIKLIIAIYFILSTYLLLSTLWNFSLIFHSDTVYSIKWNQNWFSNILNLSFNEIFSDLKIFTVLLCGVLIVINYIDYFYKVKIAKYYNRIITDNQVEFISKVFSFPILFFLVYKIFILCLIVKMENSYIVHFDEKIIVAIIVLPCFIFAKAMLTPLLLACALAWSVFAYGKSGTFDIIPLVQLVIERLMSEFSKWIQYLYAYFTVIYMFFAALTTLPFNKILNKI